MYALNSVRSILKFWCNEKILKMKFQSAWMMSELLKMALDSGLRGSSERVRREHKKFYFLRGPIIHMLSTGNAEAGFSRQLSAVRKCSLLLTGCA